MSQTIALVATSILSVVFMTTTIIEHNQVSDLTGRCAASARSNAAAVKAMMNLLDSAKPSTDKNGKQHFPLF